MLAFVTHDSSVPADDAPATTGAQTVDRALRVLDLLGPGPYVGGLTVSEIARELDVGRPVVYRLVRSLEQRQFLRRTFDGRYRLGYAVYRLASAVSDTMADVAVPILRKLADDVGATAHLTLVQGSEAVAVAVVEPSWTSMHVTYRVGARHPLDRGAAGRAVLAGRAGNYGVIASTGELQGGAHGLAAPVPHLPRLEASVGVVSLTPLDAASIGPQVIDACEQMAVVLRD